MKITIIGSGIIGLFSAYYLQENGHDVTIIDRGDGSEGCSLGNAGMVVPSHFIPLAVPGMIEKGIKWMFDSESPFYVKPRLNLELISWGLKFYQAANKKQVEKAMPALRDYGLLSKKLYQQFSEIEDFAFEEKGLMMLCKTQHCFEEEAHTAGIANGLGIEAKVLTVKELHALEPTIKPTVAGAVFYPGDAHLYPNLLVKKLVEKLIKKGVNLIYNTEVIGFEIDKDQIKSIKTNHQKLPTDQLIIASGSWSPLVAKMLNLQLPMQAGKGYSITKNQIKGNELQIPSILLEARVAITPMANDLIRIGGTMEIGGINSTINMNRVRGIMKSIPEYFPDYKAEIPLQKEVWHGLRPCSPDGLPYLGRTEKYKNVVIASGHAMMGLSLAPATGKLVQELIENSKTSIDISLYKPERFD